MFQNMLHNTYLSTPTVCVEYNITQQSSENKKGSIKLLGKLEGLHRRNLGRIRRSCVF
jgi:hypothetical protein